MATNEYPPVPEDFKLYFYTLGDINKDGVIDMLDAILISKYFGQADTEADINGDGKVDILDAQIVSKNYGKTVEAEWHKTVDQQRAEEAAAATTGAAVVPWYIEWARELAKLQAANDQAYANWLDPAMQSFMDNIKALADMPDSFWKGNISNADDLLDAQIKAASKNYINIASLPLSETPRQDYVDEFGVSKALADKLAKDIGMPMGMLPLERYKENKNGADTLSQIQSAILDSRVNIMAINQALKDLSLGSVDLVEKTMNLQGSAYGWDQVSSLATTLPINAAVVEPARQYWNSVYLPYIPGIGDIVRMYANGKITDADYAETMAMLGYDEYWQAKYWEAHWTKPNVADALTAWRRGKLDDDELTAVMTNADLDPAWKAIWQERKFNDLSFGMAHELYDMNLMNIEAVLDVAKRNGFNEVDVLRVADSVTHFPVRRLKLRYLLTLTLGVQNGYLTQQDVADGVKKLGYADAVTEWIMNVGLLKQSITKRRVTAAGSKLLDLPDLKKAYMRGLVTEDVLRTELQVRGYPVGDVQILIELLNEDRTVEAAGGKTKGLSVTELLNAYRYGVITEDVLRTTLLTRGLPLDEVDVLIKTKNMQWKISPQPLASQIMVYLGEWRRGQLTDDQFATEMRALGLSDADINALMGR